MKKLTTLFLALILLLGLGTSAFAAEETATPAPVPTEDPSGAPITVPDKIESIAVLAPSLTQMVLALGRGDQIVAYDTNSAGLEGLDPDAPVFDMVAPDMEQLAALQADLVLVSDMSLHDQFQLRAHGVHRIHDEVVDGQIDLWGGFGQIEQLARLDSQIRIDLQQALRHGVHLVPAHGLAGGDDLAIQIGDADSVIVEQVDRAEAAAHQRLRGVAADAAHAEDRHAGRGEPAHPLAAQEQFRSRKLIHRTRPARKDCSTQLQYNMSVYGLWLETRPFQR